MHLMRSAHGDTSLQEAPGANRAGALRGVPDSALPRV